MSFEFSATLGDIITAAAFFGGAILAAGAMRGKLKDHDEQIAAVKGDIKALAGDMRQLAEKMGELVKFSGRLDRMDDRAIMQGGRIDENNKMIAKIRDDVEDFRREYYAGNRAARVASGRSEG